MTHTWTRQARWTYVSRAPIADYEFYRVDLPRLEARKRYEQARLSAIVHGGAGKLLRNGKRVASFSHIAENE